MTEEWASVDPDEKTIRVQGKPLESLRRLRKGDYLMQMATGGSTSLPLMIHMTKHHAFSMLFTIFQMLVPNGMAARPTYVGLLSQKHLQHR